MQNYSINNLKGQATDIIAEGLKAAEMRQSCTDYGYYAEILLKQVEPIIFKYAPNNNVDKSTDMALRGQNNGIGEGRDT